MNNTLINKKLPMILAGFFLLALSGCFDLESPEPVPVAYVSLYHASQDTPPLDIIVRSQKINDQPFKYADYIGYRQFYTGDRVFQLKKTTGGEEILVNTINLKADKFYSVFLVNSLSSIETFVIEDFSDAPSTGKAMVRFVHLSQNAPEVSFYQVKDQEQNLINEEIGFKSGTAFKEVDANATSFMVAIPGAEDEPVEMLVENESVSVKAGNYYTFVLRGVYASGEGADAGAETSNGLYLDYLIN